MSNILEYTLTLQDKLSAKLKTIGVNSDTALEKFGALQSKARALKLETDGLGRSIYTLKNRIDLLQQERDLLPASSLRTIRAYNSEIHRLEAQLTRLQTVNGNPIRTMFSQAMASIPFAGLLTNPLVAAGAIAAGSFKVGFQNEMAGAAFETMLGKSMASKIMLSIRDYADKTPYENVNLQENAKMLLGFGVNAERIMPTLKILGDIAMGDTNKMQSLTLAFSQMSANGRLMGQDLLQMVNAGFNPLQEISRKTGKSLSALRKDMEQGRISSDMVTAAFRSATAEGGRFYGMTEKMANTGKGKWSTFLDSMKTTLLKVYDILKPAVIPTLEALTKLVGLLASGVQFVTYRLQRYNELMQSGNVWAIAITAAIGSLLTVMIAYNSWIGIVSAATSLWTFVQNGLNTAFWANPVTWIIAAIIALAAAIAYVIYKTSGWAKLWDGVVVFLKLKWEVFKGSFLVAWLEIQDAFARGVDFIMKAWYKVQRLWDKEGADQGLRALSTRANDRAGELARQRANLSSLNSKANQALSDGLSSLKWDSSKKLSDIAGSMKSKLGISAPVVPGAGFNSGTGDGNSAAAGVTNNVTAGGTRNTDINIHIGNMVENLSFDGSLADNAQDIEQRFTELLLRALNMAYATA